MTFARIGLTMLSLLVIAGCRSSVSPIVSQVEAAGAGRLDGTAEPSVEVWMGTHADLAKKLTPECNERMKKGFDAAWVQSTEGVVCTAAARVAARAAFFGSSHDAKDPYKPY